MTIDILTTNDIITLKQETLPAPEFFCFGVKTLKHAKHCLKRDIDQTLYYYIY